MFYVFPDCVSLYKQANTWKEFVNILPLEVYLKNIPNEPISKGEIFDLSFEIVPNIVDLENLYGNRLIKIFLK